MVRPLELELRTYDRERGRLEDEHRGKFVLIGGAEIAGIFDDFQTASEHAARRFEREAYLVHCIGAEPMRVPSRLLDGWQLSTRMPEDASNSLRCLCRTVLMRRAKRVAANAAWAQSCQRRHDGLLQHAGRAA